MKEKLTRTYSIYSPVYASRQEVLASVKSAASRDIESPGKIYIFGKYIFLNEVNKGIHIIDNANPKSPVRKAFVKIPGNVDLAVKGNVLYADMYSDLLTIDITNPLNVKLVKAMRKVFPDRLYEQPVADSNLLIVDWIKKDTTVEITAPELCANCMYAGGDMSAMNKSNSSGKGGSMARFSIVNDYLYTVGRFSLNVFTIKNRMDPQLEGTKTIGMDIETIYPFKNKLFIGSSSGMFIYNISNASQPTEEGRFNHARACDPVVADDNLAYVTLRTGAFCGGASNVLDVIDVTNVASPRLLRSYQLFNPHGLAIDGKLLFVCDGTDGLKMYNTSQPANLKPLHHVQSIDAFDVIAHNNVLLVVTSKALLQFSYSSGEDLRFLSSIATR